MDPFTVMQVEYGPPISPFNQFLNFLPQILLILSFPALLIVGFVIHTKKKKTKKK